MFIRGCDGVVYNSSYIICMLTQVHNGDAVILANIASTGVVRFAKYESIAEANEALDNLCKALSGNEGFYDMCEPEDE